MHTKLEYAQVSVFVSEGLPLIDVYPVGSATGNPYVSSLAFLLEENRQQVITGLQNELIKHARAIAVNEGYLTNRNNWKVDYLAAFEVSEVQLSGESGTVVRLAGSVDLAQLLPSYPDLVLGDVTELFSIFVSGG